ncbi:MAG: diguanylate cyclase, partial [Colwellia sp.]|nr:diguanylate cyclase [Colwellia sp.]
MGFIGAIINLFPIELAFNISLLIGNTVYIIAASFLRPQLTLLTALICVTPLYFYWGHPYGFLTFGLEALFISTMRNRGWYVLSADLLYWLVIGMPVTAFLIWINIASPENFILFSTFKQAINAVFYTSLATIMLFMFNDTLQKIKSEQPPLQKSLPKWLLYSFWSISAFLVISISLVLSTDFGKRQRVLYDRELEINNQYITHIGNSYLTTHQVAIKNIANQLSNLSKPEDRHQALQQLHQLYPGFLTMLVTSEQGNIETASPLSMLKKVDIKKMTVADRPYFIHAMEKQQLFVSSVFLGRGFGSDPIVAISAPIYTGLQKDTPSGIVEGSLNLGKFGLYDAKGHDKSHAKIIITDPINRIIYASKSLGLSTLSELKFESNASQKANNLMTFKAGERAGEMFIYKQAYLANQWKTYSLVEHGVVLKTTENMYLVIFITLFIVLLFASFFSTQFADYLNRPLAFVIKQLSQAKHPTDFKDIPYEAAEEIDALYQELKIGRQALLHNQRELQHQVATRTKELNKANDKLTELVNTDVLTGIYNRRYLKKNFSVIQSIQSRNHSNLMYAIIDLDLFKDINDTYGHLFGDYCLTKVAKILKQFFHRDADIVARFGGEEFVIVTPCNDVDRTRLRLDELRLAIASSPFKEEAIGSINLTVSMGVAIGDASFSSL